MSSICYLSSVIVCSNAQGRPDGTLPQVSRHQDNVVRVLLNSLPVRQPLMSVGKVLSLFIPNSHPSRQLPCMGRKSKRHVDLDAEPHRC